MAEIPKDDDPFASMFADQPGMPDATSEPVTPAVPPAPPTAPAVPGSRRALREAEEAKRAAQEQKLASPEQFFAASDGPAAGRPLTSEPQGRIATSPVQKPQKDRGWLKGLIVLVIILGALVAGGIVVANLVGPKIAEFFQGEQLAEYPGPGTDPTQIVINEGDLGGTIADSLEQAGVVADADSFYKYLISLSEEPTFMPGTWQVLKESSNAEALDSLLDEGNRLSSAITIPEGYSADQIFEALSTETEIPIEDFEDAAKDYEALGVPSDFPSIEGFLFPATYEFEPDTDAAGMLTAMVDRMKESLTALDVPETDWLEVLTMAGLVQREGRLHEDFAKMARVFYNRIEGDETFGYLQSDATVAYGTGNTHTVETTPEERADASNLYNTYAHPGLPPGPISNPGDAAIEAALNPAEGDWFYFVTVNLDTGETLFANTYDEHLANVAQWEQWMTDNDRWE